MSVLVTGGAGYIGSHMVLELLGGGQRVVVIDDLSTGRETLVAKEAALVVGDVGDEALVERVIRDHDVDAIIHFAGSIVVPDSVIDPLGYYLNNTVKSRALMAVAVRTSIRHFIFSSSAAVYGLPAVNPVAEDAELLPISPYGSSKLMTEIMLRDVAAAHELRYVALRYFNVAGADPAGRAGQASRRATHLIKIASEAAVGKRPYMEVYGTDYPTADGTCIRDYIHVSDLVRAHSAALAYLRAGGSSDAFNCGYSHGASVLEVIDAVKRNAGTDFEVRMAGRRAGDPPALVAQSARIRATLGWEPVHDDLDRIVQHALAWERKFNG